MGYFGFLMVNGILIGGVYALVALGMVLIYKSSSVLNLAQGNFLSISAISIILFFLQRYLFFCIFSLSSNNT